MIFYFILKLLGKSLETLANTFGARSSDHNSLLSPSESEALSSEFLNLLFQIKHTASIERISKGIATLQGVFFRLPQSPFRSQIDGVVQFIFSFIETPRFNNILKRSAAVPFLLIALLKVEPKVNGGQLLKKCLSKLLHFSERVIFPESQKDESANTDSEDLMVSAVHSLNALKFIFFDSQLKSKVVDSLEEVLRLSIKGFSHPSWSVRNSSLMLYTAVVRTSLKTKQENSGRPS